MIGYLAGKIVDKFGDGVIVGIGGVGYRVKMLVDAEVGSKVELYVHTHVREDEISLYGFSDKKALQMFELLIGVSGVGPKMGMNILAKGNAETIQRAVATADVGFFTSVSGIGKKNGQRIIVDLRTKLGSVAELDLAEEGEDEVAQALVSMGYDRERVGKVLRGLGEKMSEGEKIKVALKELSK